MGRIVSSYIFPHPPIIVPEVGKGGELGAINTLNACKKAAEEIRNEHPTTIIITSPHGPLFQDYIYMSTDDVLEGDLGRFGSKNTSLKLKNNIGLVNRIIEHARSKNIYAGGLDNSLIKEYGLSKSLDHGALIPLYFIHNEYNEFKLVHISIAGLPFEDLYKFGMCISKAIDESNENIVFVGSGDLSHRLTPEAPYGFNKRGKEFDDLLIDSFKSANIQKLLTVDEGLCESAGECGLRSFIMMFGALDGYELRPELYSYEGPFGIGYSVARFTPGQLNPERKILEKILKENEKKMETLRKNEDHYVRLARTALEAYIKDGTILEVPNELPPEMLQDKAGTFVSIKKNGQLRGCIGTIGPTRESIAEEIIHNAISSGTKDPRFDPVDDSELDALVYSVDVLRDPEPIQSMDELDVIRYGVIVKSQFRSGLLLPNLEGVDTPEEQVSIALQKAGIKPNSDYSMERFEVIRHK